MPAVTLLGSAAFDTASGSKTVTATPAVGDLIVIVTAHSGNVSSATPTDNNSSGVYTTINSALKATSADKLMIHIRNALIGAASSTVFTHAPGTSTGGGLAVFKVTGMGKVGAAAAKQSAKQDNQAAAGTPSPTFGATPQLVNAIIGAIFNATNPATMTPRASYTERNDSGYNSPASGLETMSRDSGETVTAIAWGSTSASAFCSLVLELDSSKDLTPALFTNAQSFFAPTVTPGAVTLTPSLVTGSQSFFDPTVTQTSVVTPPLLANAQSFFAPALTVGAVTLSPSLVTGSQSFFGPAVTPGAVTLSPSLLSGGQTFYGPTLTLGAVTLSPPLLSGGQTFYGPTLTLGAVTLSPPLVAGDQVFFAPAVTPGAVTLSPPLVTGSQSFFAPALSLGLVTLSPPLVAGDQVFFGPTVTPGAVTLSPPLLAGDQVFFDPAVAPGAVTLSPPLLAGDQLLFAPVLTLGALTLTPPLLAGDQVFFGPAVTPGAVTLSPPLLAGDETFFGPSLSLGLVTLEPPLIASDGEIFTPALSAANDVWPPLIDSVVVVFVPQVSGGAVAPLFAPLSPGVRMTKQRQVLLAVKELVAGALPLAKIRGFDGEATKPDRIGAGGCVIGHPGEPGEPEIDLSPLAYNYTHRIFLEVAAADGAAGEDLDLMLLAIGDAIEADRYLGGLCSWIEAEAPDRNDRSTDAVATINWATVPIAADYSVSTPLASA